MTAAALEDLRLVVLRQRFVLGLWTVLVATLPWLWRPGLMAPDTKLDLVTNPWGYLSRALVAWDERAGFGQLQNQAHGYLFPMGPFFGVGHSLDVPEWAVQRAWWSLLLVVGFVGAERALRGLGVGSGLSTALPALAYALSPRVLTVLADISVEAWPAAVCPWLVVVLLPALRPGAGRRARATMAVSTGLLVTAIGGVNAAASLLVLVVPGVLLVTAPSQAPRTRIALWWLSGVLLGAVWWMVPLVVLGFYAFPFLEFIETSSVTTSVTSVPQVLRGASHWLAYVVGPDGQADWRAGWSLAQDSLAVVGTSLLAGLGVAGLVRRRIVGGEVSGLHVERFAIITLLLGVLVMSAGYAGRYGGGFSSTVQQLLDGPLAAFRNVHKADPLVRFPLAIGLGWVLQAAPGRLAGLTWPLLDEVQRAEVWRRWVTGLVAAAVAVTLLPVWQGRLLPVGSFDRIPGYWSAAAELVDESAEREGGSTLLLPASRSGIYTWGRTDDEPLAALTTSPVVVRDAVMLGAPEVTRILDVVDLLVSTGARQDELAAVFARLGVARVVVRHDLSWQLLAEDPALVERTLSLSPGFRRVERFGPRSTGVSVWSVERAAAPVTAYAADAIVRVAGGPEALASLAQRDEGREVRAFAVGDDHLPEGTAVVEHVSTDTLRLRRLNTGRVIRDAYSQTLDARAAAEDRGRDLPPAGQGSPETVRVWEGVSSVRASDEASDPFALGYRGPRYGAFAAVDGDGTTSWLTSRGADSAWLELEFPDGVPQGSLRLDLAAGDRLAEIDTVRVTAGALELEEAASSEWLTVPLEGASGSTLRISLHRSSGSSTGLPIGLTEVSIEGHAIGTSLLTAHASSPGTDTYALVRDPRHRLDPSRVGEDGTSLERVISAEDARQMRAEVRLTSLGGQALERLLDAPWVVSGSSRVDDGPANRPGAALDGIPTTQWRAEVADLVPRLRLTTSARRTISSLRLSGGDRRRIVSVDLETPARTVRLGNRGGNFAPLRTRELTIVFRLRDSEGVFDSPEIQLGPVFGSRAVRLPCGEAGTVMVADRSVELKLATSRSVLLEGSPVTATLCDRDVFAVPDGRSKISVAPGRGVQGHSVLLDSLDVSAATNVPLPEPSVLSWGGNRRSFVVEPQPQGQLVAFTEGFNEGWQARIGGQALEPVRVDGWRQAFMVPAGAGGRVDAEFRPGSWYAAGLVAGGLITVLLLACAAVLWRRPGRLLPEVAAERTPIHHHRWVRLVAAAVTVLGLLYVLGGGAGTVVAVLTGSLLLFWKRSALLGPVLLVASGLVIVIFRALEDPSVGGEAAQVMTLATVSVLGWRLVLPRPLDDAVLDDEPRERRNDDASERRGDEDSPESS